MKVEPQDAFMLPSGSLQELHIGIRPMFASSCSQLMYINVVDVELHQVCSVFTCCMSTCLFSTSCVFSCAMDQTFHVMFFVRSAWK